MCFEINIAMISFVLVVFMCLSKMREELRPPWTYFYKKKETLYFGAYKCPMVNWNGHLEPKTLNVSLVKMFQP